MTDPIRHELTADTQGWPAGTEVNLLTHDGLIWRVRVVGHPVVLEGVPTSALGVIATHPPVVPVVSPMPKDFGHPEFRERIPLPGTWERVRVPFRR